MRRQGGSSEDRAVALSPAGEQGFLLHGGAIGWKACGGQICGFARRPHRSQCGRRRISLGGHSSVSSWPDLAGVGCGGREVSRASWTSTMHLDGGMFLRSRHGRHPSYPGRDVGWLGGYGNSEGWEESAKSDRIWGAQTWGGNGSMAYVYLGKSVRWCVILGLLYLLAVRGLGLWAPLLFLTGGACCTLSLVSKLLIPGIVTVKCWVCKDEEGRMSTFD